MGFISPGMPTYQELTTLNADDSYRTHSIPNRRESLTSLPVASSHINLGNVARDAGDLSAAMDHYKKALAIHERLAPNTLTHANSLNGVVNVSRSRGDFTAAHDYQSRALAIRERLAPNSLDVALSLKYPTSVANRQLSIALQLFQFFSRLRKRGASSSQNCSKRFPVFPTNSMRTIRVFAGGVQMLTTASRKAVHIEHRIRDELHLALFNVRGGALIQRSSDACSHSRSLTSATSGRRTAVSRCPPGIGLLSGRRLLNSAE
jgi:hypothetical protein